MFILTIIVVLLPILVESLSLVLQLKSKKLSRWFGKNAFNIHTTITVIFWIVAFFSTVILQFEKHPTLHKSIFLKYTGLILLISGGVITVWAYKLLGFKRALCINFFEDNVPVVETSIYKYFKNPLDIGFWIALIGFALFTKSIYNLVIAAEFIAIMIPHIILENIPMSSIPFNRN